MITSKNGKANAVISKTYYSVGEVWLTSFLPFYIHKMEEQEDRDWESMRERSKKVADLLIDLEIEFDYSHWGSLEGMSIKTENVIFDFHKAGATSLKSIKEEDDD